MEQEKLNFLETLTVDQFKAKHHVNELEILKNPHTGFLFFSFGAESGAVAKSVAAAGKIEKPMVSYVEGTPTQRNPSGKFWMLHEKGTGGATVMFTL